MQFGLRDDDIRIIADCVSRHNGIEDILIFGSRAIGDYQVGSDIDLAVKGSSISYNEISKIRYELNEEVSFPYYVDVVHYETISNLKLKEHIDTYGVSMKTISNKNQL